MRVIIRRIVSDKNDPAKFVHNQTYASVVSETIRDRLFNFS